MDARSRLESNLVAEAEAYGYTLSIWGSGALLIHAFGVPGVARALAYVYGAIAGFAVLALVAFPSITEQAAVERSASARVASMLHLVATGGTLELVNLFIVTVGDRRVTLVFFSAGVIATVSYNLLLLLEELATSVLT